MIISTLSAVPGKSISEHYWVVNWSTVRTKNALKDFGAWIKNMFGWELHTYSKLLDESREEALERMIAEAQEKWANAIIGVRFSTSSVASWAAEIYVYWTAVRVS